MIAFHLQPGKSMSKRRPVGVAVVVLVLLFVAAFDRPAQGAPIVPQAGDFAAHNQVFWGDPTYPAGVLLNTYFDDVYAATGGVLEVGLPGAAGYSMAFQSRDNVLAYLPAVGPIGPLMADVIDPSTTASGAFGGEVVALTLNVDFSDAGLLPGAAGVAFGDLLLADFSGALVQLNGMTLRQFLAEGNTLLGGGSSAFGLQAFHEVIQQINASFEDGSTADQAYDPAISAWAQEHLRIAEEPVSVPEPATLLLLGGGLAVAGFRRSRRRSV